MIEVEALTQRYGDYTAVREVSFALEPGEIVGFLGPNGAGKTTTLKVLAGYLLPSQGRALVAGHDVVADPLAVQRQLGYLPEHCPLYDEMFVEDFLTFVARVRGVPAGGETLRAIERVAAQCRLEEVRGRPISELSKGYRQRVGIAQALLHEPAVLVLDEPTHGLDPNQVLEVRELVKELGQERTVIFSSHVLSEVEATCERVLVIHQGRLVADGTLTELSRRATGGRIRVVAAAGAEARANLASALEGADWLAGVEPDRTSPAGLMAVPDFSALGDDVSVDEVARRLFAAAAAAETPLSLLAPVELTLEDVFQALTNKGAPLLPPSDEERAR